MQVHREKHVWAGTRHPSRPPLQRKLLSPFQALAGAATRHPRVRQGRLQPQEAVQEPFSTEVDLGRQALWQCKRLLASYAAYPALHR